MASQVVHISIDKFGRVVLPKELRDHLRLKPGTELEVEEREDAIFLKPVRKQAKIVYESGWPVIQTGPLSEDSVREAIERSREERIREIWSFSVTPRS